MARRAPIYIYGTLLLALGMGILLAGTPSGAEAPLATLTVAPGADVKPGETVSFSVEIPYSDPAPVVAVMVDGAMWSTERQSVTFPGVGRPATVKFTKAYPVPPDAKPGTAICFVLVKGEEKSASASLSPAAARFMAFLIDFVAAHSWSGSAHDCSAGSAAEPNIGHERQAGG